MRDQVPDETGSLSGRVAVTILASRSVAAEVAGATDLTQGMPARVASKELMVGRPGVLEAPRRRGRAGNVRGLPACWGRVFAHFGGCVRRSWSLTRDISYDMILDSELPFDILAWKGLAM